MYLLTNNQFINALVAKKNAGLDVQVVLNQTFPTSSTVNNNNVFTQLQNAGVDVVWASSAFNFTHSKCVIVDGTTAWIMTMNVTFSSPTQNREYLAIDTDPDDVAEAEAVFQADHAQTTASVAGKLLVAPVNARDGLLGLVQNATTKLDLEGEELSDATLVPALVDAKNRGVAVRVVLADSTPSNAMATAVQSLQADGIEVKKLSVPYIHAKAIVADDTLAYVGSANFTQNSLDSNREIGLVISNPDEVAKVEAAVDGDFTAGVPY
jgi:cardiolipin synthase